MASAGPLDQCWQVVVPVIEAVSALPFNGKGVQEKADGDMVLTEEGVWVFAFNEEYKYPENTGFDETPNGSRAEVILGIQARQKFLNAIVADKPQRAMMSLTWALRSAIQTASAAFTFRNANPAFACRMIRTEQLFSDTLGLAVIQATLELKGFDS